MRRAKKAKIKSPPSPETLINLVQNVHLFETQNSELLQAIFTFNEETLNDYQSLTRILSSLHLYEELVSNLCGASFGNRSSEKSYLALRGYVKVLEDLDSFLNSLPSIGRED